MATNIEDFVKRLTRGNKKFTFIFSEDFFNIEGKDGVDTNRFRNIRNTVRQVKHRRGLQAETRLAEGATLFDVNIGVVKNGFTSFMTDFTELTDGPFAETAMLFGMGEEGGQVDAQKAQLQVSLWLAEKNDLTLPTTQLVNECKKRKIILVADGPNDLKRPSMEPFIKLRSQLTKILISPVKGPIVDCQVGKIFEPGNSSSLSTLLNMFCVNY